MIERIAAYTTFLVVGFLSGCGASSPDAHFQKVEKAAFTAPAEEALNYILECSCMGADPLRLEIKNEVDNE